jgi:hypothetical protein
MRELVDKYPDGYEGYAKEHGLHIPAKRDIEEATEKIGAVKISPETAVGSLPL